MKHLLKLAIVMLAVVFVSSCRTKYITTETVRFQTDTVWKTKTDYVVKIHIQREKDSIIIRDSVVITTDTAGNVKSKERVRIITKVQQRTDSVDHYRHLADSLKNVSLSSETRVVVKERALGWWESLKMKVGGVGIITTIILMLVVIIYRFVKFK
jgi:hypothetical protein